MRILLFSSFLVSVFAQVQGTAIRAGCAIFNFESPLQGWQFSGQAFNNQPIFGGKTSALGHYGNWLIDSSSNATSPCERSGASIGGSLKGVMTSPLFQIRASKLSFLIGGGCNVSKVRVELIVDNKTLFQDTGSCVNHMVVKHWDVKDHLGKVGQIRIVDNCGDESWGYIAFDDLRTADECGELQPCTINQSMCLEKNEQSKGFVCRCQSSPTGFLPCDNQNCQIKNGNCQTFCTTNDCKCQQCTCHSGYIFNASTLTCDDINECANNSGGCNHGCVNTLGSFRCTCRSGYRLNSDNKSCVDIDECETQEGRCENAVCANTVGSYNCMCKSGWKKNVSDPFRCIDIDECTENLPCKLNEVCFNTPGSYRCDCQPGFQGSSRGCVVINKCATANGGCEQECTSIEASYRCSCRAGYKINSDGKTCSDINECEKDNGGCQQKCQNTDGGFECGCENGYLLSNDSVTCRDVNECEIDSKCSHICNNTVGGYTCSCRHGYQLQPDNVTCLDIDECLLDKGNCSQLCLNTNGSYCCSCYQGYRLSKDGMTCDNVDECNGSSDCQQLCTNSQGIYRCSCLPGYELDKDNKTCHDVNECSHKSKQVCEYECVNNPGSFKCACPKGLVLDPDNRTCVDIDECQIHDTCQENCVNLKGSYRCFCSEGKVLQSDGKTCKVPVALDKALDTAKNDIKGAKSTTALINITKTLTDSLPEKEQISSSDLKNTVEVLDQLRSKVSNGNINSSVDCAKQLLKSYVKIVSNVLKPVNKESWLNMSGGSSNVANIPAKVEEMSEAIFKLVKSENLTALNVTVNNENIDLQFEVTKRKEFRGSKYYGKTAKVELHESIVRDSSKDDYVGFTIVDYKSLNIHMSANNISNQTETSQRKLFVNSVISVKVINVNKTYLARLEEPVTLSFLHKESSNALLTCSFINDSAASMLSKDKILWASEGCWINTSHSNITVCQCNHTTSYGLLMDVHQIYDTLDNTHKVALKYISLIGCSISIVFCFLTVLALTLAMRRPLEKKARFETFKLHINLVIAIGFAQIWFVVGSFLVDVELVACRVVSVFTHYFLTASFCWMLAEGINVYNKIVKVFSTKKYGKFYFTLGWGVPLVLVIVTSAAVFNKYGSQKICWIQEEVIWVFAVPVLVIIVANFFVLLSVVYVLLRKTMAFTSLPNKPKESPKVKRTVKVTVVLLPLLGLTWVFGFLAIDKNFIVFHYLFAIINSFQGFFIFIAHCWINDSIRGALLEKLPSLPNTGKYKEESRAEGSQKVTTVDSAAFDTLTQSVPMPVHITMSTVQLLNLGKNTETRTSCEAINDCMEMEQDNQLPGLAQ